MKIIKFALLLLLILTCETIGGYAQEVRILFGNPSNAVTNEASANNYLLVHNGYIMSYNRERGAANWVNWHVERADLSGVERNSTAFAPDMMLPALWRVRPNEYMPGYDRGHMCPSADRLSSDAANIETFLMSNMSPQVPNLNRRTWAALEKEIRKIVVGGNEAYVYAGCYGDNGKIRNKITIPTRCFKIALILREGTNDFARVTPTTRIIAADMPNENSINPDWKRYITSVDAIEQSTGFDFLSTLPVARQASLESR